MAKLTSAKRNSLPGKSFVFPGARKFPIPDASHAQNALSRASAQGGDVKAKVDAAVHDKFPRIGKKKKKKSRFKSMAKKMSSVPMGAGVMDSNDPSSASY